MLTYAEKKGSKNYTDWLKWFSMVIWAINNEQCAHCIKEHNGYGLCFSVLIYELSSYNGLIIFVAWWTLSNRIRVKNNIMILFQLFQVMNNNDDLRALQMIFFKIILFEDNKRDFDRYYELCSRHMSTPETELRTPGI